MKYKFIYSLILIATILMTLLGASVPALASTPSAWATPEMNDANMQGLLTPGAARNYQKQLTRSEFCELVVNLVERTRGKQLPLPGVNPFTDTSSVHILKAYNYGITNGTTDTTFSPDDTVQRQQICTMMIRAIQGLEQELGRTLLTPPSTLIPFVDASQISEYAVLPIRYAYTNGIMRGDDRNYVNPKNPITSEECVAIIIRSYNQMEIVISRYRTTSQNLDVAEKRLCIGFSFGDAVYGVTHDILLPTISSGGATITWTSSDAGVIRIGGAVYGNDDAQIGRTGIVSVGRNARSVTLTATITLGGQTRVLEFQLRTSTLSGDRLLLDNAYNMLDIIYINDGDSADSVTGRIGLPDKVLDIPVTWRTSNANIVTTTGSVHIPPGDDLHKVTLTATIGSGSQSRTKTFELTVINSQYYRNVLLNGVELGMTSSQVTQILGAVRRTIQASNTETWRLYHAYNNYTGFVAVAFINDRAVAVYSMASDVANQLTNDYGTAITVAQANVVNGVSAVSYADNSRQYAIMIYESDSVIGSLRTLTAERQEELLFELVNAYRVRNGLAALEWADTLRIPARQHSEWIKGNAPSNGSGSNSLRSRAAEAGFTTSGSRPLYGGGNAMAGQNDAFGFLQEIASTTAMRNEILSSSATLFGAGFASTASGAYRNYMTYMLGNVRCIINVTANPATGNPATIRIFGIGAGAAVTVTLTPAYTSVPSNSSYNEPYTAASSDTRILTVAPASGADAFILTGVSQGYADIIITGSLSGKSYSIPVSVEGRQFANSFSLYPQGTIYLVTGGPTARITAVSEPAQVTNDAITSWNYNSRVISIDSTGLVSALEGGATDVTATMASSPENMQGLASLNHVTIEVADSISINEGSLSLEAGRNLTLTHSLAGKLPDGVTAKWESSDASCAIINDTTGVLSTLDEGSTTVTVYVLYNGTVLFQSVPIIVTVVSSPTEP